MEGQKHLDEQSEKTQAVKFESTIQENDIEEPSTFFPDYSMLEHPRMPASPRNSACSQFTKRGPNNEA
jgi:hypothetical protein